MAADNKKSTLSNHVLSAGHKKAKLEPHPTNSVAKMLMGLKATPTPSLSTGVRAYRFLTARTWVDLCIPFETFSHPSAVSFFTALKVDIPQASSMREYIPLIHNAERVKSTRC